MKPLGHAAITLTIGAILYNYSRSLEAFFALLVTGVFIDLDHYLDYVRERGIDFNFARVYKTCTSYRHFKKMALFMHSYESVLLFWSLILIFDLNVIWKYAALGWTLHLVIDQITNSVFPFGYFFCFRVAKKFKACKIFIDEEVHYANRH